MTFILRQDGPNFPPEGPKESPSAVPSRFWASRKTGQKRGRTTIGTGRAACYCAVSYEKERVGSRRSRGVWGRDRGGTEESSSCGIMGTDRQAVDMPCLHLNDTGTMATLSRGTALPTNLGAPLGDSASLPAPLCCPRMAVTPRLQAPLMGSGLKSPRS